MSAFLLHCTLKMTSPSVEDDVDIWRYAIVRVACQKRWRRYMSAFLLHCTLKMTSPSVEDDVDIWRYVIVRVACQKRWQRYMSAFLLHCTQMTSPLATNHNGVSYPKADK